MAKVNLNPLLNLYGEQKVESQADSEEQYHYVFVFQNIFSTEETVKGTINYQIPVERCKTIYNTSFKISGEENPNEDQRITTLKREWKNFTRDIAGDTVEFRKFLKLMMERILHILTNDLKLEVKLYYSRDKDEIFCKMKASEYNLRVQADLMNYYLQLSRQGEPKAGFQYVYPYSGFEKDDEELGASNPLQLIASFAKKRIEDNFKKYTPLQKKAKDENLGTSLFLYKDKVRIVFEMIESVIDVGELVENTLLAGHFCLHEQAKLQFLKDNWGGFGKFYKPQPFKQIRSYFGEKISMYFAWLQYYIIWLLIPAIAGIGLFIIQNNSEQDAESSDMSLPDIAQLVFGLLLAIGSSLFDQLWHRRQGELSWMWGTVNLLVVEQQRTGFKGEYGTDPVDGRKKKISQSKSYEKFKRFIGYSVSILFVGIVVVTVIGIFMLRAAGTFSPGVCATLNGLQIKVMNFIYRRVAVKLTSWENYEYESKYMDSLTLKLYLFQFINSYLSLFYIAFFKRHYEGCKNDDCLAEVETQIVYMFIINVSMNGLELGLPLLRNWLKKRKENKEAERLKQEGESVRAERTAAEEENQLDPYETPLDDYMEIVINYGYVIMFSAAFPLLPLVALFMNLLEIRVDAYKLTHLCKRCYPDPANSIGEWEIIVRFISFLGALTNTGIIIFTADIFYIGDDIAVQWTYFLLIEHILLVIKAFIDSKIPDTPSRVKNGITWGERVANERLFGLASDEDKQKQLRGLYFTEEPGFTKVPYDASNIKDDNY
ncbi:unnamed protein product [Blepharisma stoltei]|uniref:Anoctamin transmembrane domain-containing protein n=1 Tax=Blepharisma stoltei TaxID=1481888 RepID=A0AAU9JRS8_9CILI|nr:unnamed protein product [Blepharisma stoltei]